MILKWYIVYVLALFTVITGFSTYWSMNASKESLRELERAKTQLASQTSAIVVEREKRVELEKLRISADRKLSDSRKEVAKLSNTITQLKNKLDSSLALSQSYAVKEKELQEKTKQLTQDLEISLRKSDELAKKTEDFRQQVSSLSSQLDKTNDELLQARRHVTEVGSAGTASVEAVVLSTRDPNQTPAAQASADEKKRRTITNRVNVRAGPNIRAALLKTLAPGQKIIVEGLADNKEWHRITYAGRQKGFVKSSVLQQRSQ